MFVSKIKTVSLSGSKNLPNTNALSWAPLRRVMITTVDIIQRESKIEMCFCLLLLWSLWLWVYQKSKSLGLFYRYQIRSNALLQWWSKTKVHFLYHGSKIHSGWSNFPPVSFWKFTYFWPFLCNYCACFWLREFQAILRFYI